MSTSVLIMASGENPEWIWSHYLKHTVPIAGEPLIKRTVRQLKELGRDSIVITHRQEIQDLVSHWFVPYEYQTYAQTLLSTRKLWGEEKTLILNGDVVFSDKALKFIFNNLGELTFFSSVGTDIIGFSFSKEYYQKFEEAGKNCTRPWMAHFRDELVKVMGVSHYQQWHKTIPHDGTTLDFDDTNSYESWLKSRIWAQSGNPPKLEGLLVYGMNKGAIKAKLEDIAPWNYTIKFPFNLDTWEKDNKDWELDTFLDAGCFSKPSYARVLDLGASAGFYTNYFLENKSSYVISSDSNPRRLVQLHLIKFLKGFESRMVIPQHSINEGLHYKQQDIDLVLVRDIITYLTYLPGTFTNIFNILKPGGDCIVRAPKNSEVNVTMEKIGFNVKELPYFYGGYRLYKGEKL